MEALEATHLHDSTNGATGILQDILHTLTAGGRLVRDAAFGELA